MGSERGGEEKLKETFGVSWLGWLWERRGMCVSVRGGYVGIKGCL